MTLILNIIKHYFFLNKSIFCQLSNSLYVFDLSIYLLLSYFINCAYPALFNFETEFRTLYECILIDIMHGHIM